MRQLFTIMHTTPAPPPRRRSAAGRDEPTRAGPARGSLDRRSSCRSRPATSRPLLLADAVPAGGHRYVAGRPQVADAAAGSGGHAVDLEIERAGIVRRARGPCRSAANPSSERSVATLRSPSRSGRRACTRASREVDLEDIGCAAGLEAHGLAAVLRGRTERVARADRHADRAAARVQVAEMRAVEPAGELADTLENRAVTLGLVAARHDHLRRRCVVGRIRVGLVGIDGHRVGLQCRPP